MTKLRPKQKRTSAMQITPDVVRDNPLLGKLARIRLRELKAARDDRKATELDLD
jgi:hypothetical protein